MKKLIRMLFGVSVLAYASGCASIAATSYHNSEATKAKVVQMRALSGGEPAVGIDWAAITPGWMSAWSSRPGLMTAATVADLGTTGALIYFATQGSGGSSSKEPGVQVNGNNNTTYVNGDGTQTVNIDQSSGTP